MTPQLFDVIAVELTTSKVRVMARRKTKENAEAIVKMAVMRQEVNERFFLEMSAGDYSEGDEYTP